MNLDKKKIERKEKGKEEARLLWRLKEPTFSDATPPVYKLNHFNKMPIPF